MLQCLVALHSCLVLMTQGPECMAVIEKTPVALEYALYAIGDSRVGESSALP